MNLYTVPFYRNAPFLRIVLPFICGIYFQFQARVSPDILACFLVASLSVLFVLRWQSLNRQFKFKAAKGFLINLFVFCCGCICMYTQDETNDTNSIYHTYTPGSGIIVVINEPLAQKAGSYKCIALVKAVVRKDTVFPTTGTILIYFEKDTSHLNLRYGDILFVSANLQTISRSGNPGAFDYKRYCYFQGIYFQVFLTSKTYRLVHQTSVNRFRAFIFNARTFVVNVIGKYIKGNQEAGLAQAILIGYKDNLDKELVQSYSNTGVVHVIAISGLHLGLIYAILLLLTAKLPAGVGGRMLQLFIILGGIWIFAIIAGASASVVRSAVMFSCIATGKMLTRKPIVYNSLAASAFLLLCYNPFWLWDTGFQLSYAAVLSIIIYQKAVYAFFPLENPLLLFLWKTCAITVSAQILTTPVSLYYFHQFPLLFLVTNFVAIPLSSVILILEILLCCFSFSQPIATLLGKLTGYLIEFMNWFVSMIDKLPFANWKPLQIDTIQFLLLFAVIAGLSVWLMQKEKNACWFALLSLLLFTTMRFYSFRNAVNRQKLIVYNIKRSAATEIIAGRNSLFIADSLVLHDDAVFRFNVLPSRILHRINNTVSLTGPPYTDHVFHTPTKIIIVARGPLRCRLRPDIIVVCGNPSGAINSLFPGKLPLLFVFDSSNTKWKISRWQKECAALGVFSYSVPDEGAFVMNLN